MMRTPTLCTRPALSEGRILRQSTGLNSNPTKRSRMRRACWALTKSLSTVLGDSMAFRMAGFVISENTMRLVWAGFKLSASIRCQLIASPSRSSSVASHTVSAFFASPLSSVTTFLDDGLTSYFGVKSLSMSTLSLPLARSRMCPIEDFTTKSFPRYPSMVLAFAGDSTMTRFLAMRRTFGRAK